MITASRHEVSLPRKMRPPRVVPCWYGVCASSELRRGKILRFDLGGVPIVLFRGRDNGVVHALPAHCLHQGVDLSHGTVVKDCLRCPLHHWEYTDRCVRPRPSARAHFSVAERYGMIFLYPGDDPAHPLPGFSVPDEQLHFRSGKAVPLDCPWYVPVANAFDMTHLETVHRRRLMHEPVVSRPDPFTFRVDYGTAVTGRGLSDRAMRILSGNDIRVNVTCTAGTMVQVESATRHWRSYLLVSLRPTRAGVSFLPLFGVPRRRGGAHLLHARLAASLFTAFLIRDVHALSGIRFPEGFADSRDPTISACHDFLCELPELESGETG
jgi:nitrite reductase/ring-hydroxylating ferredoxin subunit